MDEITNNKFNTFSTKDSGMAFSVFSIVSVLASFVLGLVASIILLMATGNQEQANNMLTSPVGNIILSALMQGCLLASAFILAKVVRVDLIKAAKINVKPDIKTILVCMAYAFGIVFALAPLSGLFMNLLEKIGYHEAFDMSVDSVGMYILCTLFMCAVPAFIEETLFRGVILQGLKPQGNVFAILISAFLFSLFHQNPTQTIHQFLVGVIWATIALKTGSLWPTIIMHFLNNFIVITEDFIMNMVGATTISPAVEYSLMGVGILVFVLCTIYFVFKFFVKKKDETLEDKDSEDEIVRVEKSVSGEEYEIINDLSRARIKKGKFFIYAAAGIGLCAIMWVLTLLLGMGVITL